MAELLNANRLDAVTPENVAKISGFSISIVKAQLSWQKRIKPALFIERVAKVPTASLAALATVKPVKAAHVL